MKTCRFMMYAEGGSKTFMGHLMRTVTLADSFRRFGIEVLFVTSSEDGKRYIRENGFSVIMVDELDYDKLAILAHVHNVGGILVDRFGFTNMQHQLLVDQVGLLVQIDDFLYDGPAQLVINSTVDKKPDNRCGRWLCGGDYAIVRKQFVNKDKKILEVPENVLLTTGYGDPGNVHLKVLDILQKLFNDLNIHVIVGGGYETKSQLRERAVRNRKIILHEDMTDISGIMNEADFAVSAAGTTLYELAAAGVPTIAFSLYDNQLDNIARVEKKGCIIAVGWYEEIDYAQMEKQILDLYENFELRKRLSTNGRRWIDGRGSERIAQIVLEGLEREKDSGYDNKIVEY